MKQAVKNSPKRFLNALIVATALNALGWAIAQTPQHSAQVATQVPLVSLSMIVTDKSNHSVDDVERNELQVFEDGKPQELSTVTKEKKAINYVIAIDNSLSFKHLLAPSLEACKVIIDDNGTDDETAIVSFVSSDKISNVQDFTSDKSRLVDSLKQVRLEGGQSALIDAVYMAVQAAASNKAPEFTGRRAVVLITDGEDRHSYYRIEALVKLLRESSVQIFAIGIVIELENEGLMTNPQKKAKELLDRLTRETGGRTIFARNASELRTAAQEIAHDLRAQFIISYRLPANQTKGFHKVEVKIVGARKLKAITRPGYVAH